MTQISASDYNNIRNKIVSILGPGLAQQGYGQPFQSNAITPGTVITAAQWDDIRFDILSAKVHQDGNLPTITDVGQRDVIRSTAGDPRIQYNNLVDGCVQNKFIIGQAQFVVNNRGSRTYTSAWTTQLTCTVTITFINNDQARYFFNSGGKIRFFSSRLGGSPTSQNSSWSNLLAGIGTVSFGADTATQKTYYQLTGAYQTVFSQSANSAYASNSFSVEARCDVANNVNGEAESVDFRIRWTDAYVDPDTLNPLPSPPSFAPSDLVDGTISLQIEELKASGNLFPTGTFTIASPTYSISTITGS
jgi:hypothetical protein